MRPLFLWVLMAFIYVDESGDTGWTFDAPYRRGGSSRFLTIAAVIVSDEKRHHTKRVIKSLYGRLSAPPADEIKWVHLTDEHRAWLANQITLLQTKLGSDLLLTSMTVRKEKVFPHIRKEPNFLYNYMLNLLLSQHMAKHQNVTLIPDQRSIKVSSGSTMHDYLQTQLWFEHQAITKLKTTPLDSRNCMGLQFADMLAGFIQSHYEDGKSHYITSLRKHIKMRELYF